MSELEEKLGSVLNNPQLMQQIFSMAQSMGSMPSPTQEKTNDPPPAKEPESKLDPQILQSLANIAQRNQPDPNQKNLIHALSPYLSQNRIHKLERAMQAAHIAGVASSFLNSGGFNRR